MNQDAIVTEAGRVLHDVLERMHPGAVGDAIARIEAEAAQRALDGLTFTAEEIDAIDEALRADAWIDNETDIRPRLLRALQDRGADRPHPFQYAFGAGPDSFCVTCNRKRADAPHTDVDPEDRGADREDVSNG